MSGEDGDGIGNAGPGGPAGFGAGLTSEEKAAIGAYLNNRWTVAPSWGWLARLAEQLLKVAGALLLVCGVAAGVGDGNDFDDVGCSIAQQPAAHGGSSARPRREDEDGEPGPGGRPAGGVARGEWKVARPARPACEVSAEWCVNRAEGGACRVLRQRCRILQMQQEEWKVENAARTGRMMGAINEIWRVVTAIAKRGEVVAAPVSEGEARRVFMLMKGLADGPKQEKAPLSAVFRLVVLEGCSQKKAARLCGCVPALISRRVKVIESRFGMPIERLRNFAASILEMEVSVKGDRYRKRKGGGRAGGDDGPGQADLDEADGYLPGEGSDDYS